MMVTVISINYINYFEIFHLPSINGNSYTFPNCKLKSIKFTGSGISWNQSIPSCQGCSSRAAMQVSPTVEESTVLRAELETLRIDLARANAKVLSLQENERQLKER